MSQYACDDDDLIYVRDAKPQKIYWCIDCFGPVKKRRGKRAPFYHFYHLKASPSCRLYSRTEDHLLAQIQLQKSVPEGAIQLEKPFLTVNRVADLCWEQEKIVCEFQCSLILEKEIERRINDYKTAGFDIVWLLDDRLYNKRGLKPGEESLRQKWAYFFHFKRGLASEYYDQFEILHLGQRVRKGKKLQLDLKKVVNLPRKAWDPEVTAKQILNLKAPRFCHNDRLSIAIRFPLSLLYWKSLEQEVPKKQNRFIGWFKKKIAEPYLALLDRWLAMAK
jgi:hypothetical protein